MLPTAHISRSTTMPHKMSTWPPVTPPRKRSKERLRLAGEMAPYVPPPPLPPGTKPAAEESSSSGYAPSSTSSELFSECLSWDPYELLDIPSKVPSMTCRAKSFAKPSTPCRNKLEYWKQVTATTILGYLPRINSPYSIKYVLEELGRFLICDSYHCRSQAERLSYHWFEIVIKKRANLAREAKPKDLDAFSHIYRTKHRLLKYGELPEADEAREKILQRSSRRHQSPCPAERKKAKASTSRPGKSPSTATGRNTGPRRRLECSMPEVSRSSLTQFNEQHDALALASWRSRLGPMAQPVETASTFDDDDPIPEKHRPGYPGSDRGTRQGPMPKNPNVRAVVPDKSTVDAPSQLCNHKCLCSCSTLCGHSFCPQCIVEWLQSGLHTCPTCRQYLDESMLVYP